MKRKILLLLLLLLIIMFTEKNIFTADENTVYVINKNGAELWEAPAIESKKIIVIPYKTEAKIIETKNKRAGYLEVFSPASCQYLIKKIQLSVNLSK